MSRVRVKRYWEIYCEAHGVMDMCPLYKDAKRAKEQHRADHPECLSCRPCFVIPTRLSASGISRHCGGTVGLTLCPGTRCAGVT